MIVDVDSKEDIHFGMSYVKLFVHFDFRFVKVDPFSLFLVSLIVVIS